MKRFGLLLVFVVVFCFALMAEAAGPYVGYMTSDGSGKNRSVVIINTVTGDFEVYDIDNKGLNRKKNTVYYDCIKYDREGKVRKIEMIETGE